MIAPITVYVLEVSVNVIQVSLEKIVLLTGARITSAAVMVNVFMEIVSVFPVLRVKIAAELKDVHLAARVMVNVCTEDVTVLHHGWVMIVALLQFVQEDVQVVVYAFVVHANVSLVLPALLAKQYQRR